MPQLNELRRLTEAAEIRASNSADIQLCSTEAERLRKGAATARAIIAALETDEELLENAALQLAWSRVLEQLLTSGEELKDSVCEIQKLCASSRARRNRRKADPRQQQLSLGGIAPATMTKIEQALQLL